ncbi:MAG TPA: hypothetical protein VNJ46_04120 [Gaiellaceae bacterium]|nr:hypothetical protein [Gaiellaceae bacterium]
MLALRSWGLVGAAAAACAALPTIAAGALPAGTATQAAPARAAANSVTYQDSTGEDPQGPDITTIVVSNDDAGMLSFRINIPNRPQLGQDMIVDIWVDTDNNRATGDPERAGVDYVMQLVRGEINLYRWDGSTFSRRFGDPSAITLSFQYQGGITVRISANELGQTKAFRFFVSVASGCVVDPTTGDLDCANARADDAPGGGAGLYPFEVKISPPRLLVRRVTTAPRAPRAGQPFTMRLVAARSDTGAVIQNGRVTCRARAGTTRLRAQVARVQAGAATCTWLIPANAKGKTFLGTVTVVFEGLRASSTISRRIG